MSKLNITTNHYIENPSFLKNIDIQYGFSYITKPDYKLKIINSKNSWSVLVLKNLNKMRFLFKKKLNENKETFEYIIDSASFIKKKYKEESENLHIQTNEDNSLTTNYSYILGKRNINDEDLITQLLSGNVSEVYTHNKNIFLGLDFFKPEKEFYYLLNLKLSKNEVVDFIVFHEFYHCVDVMNKNSTNAEQLNIIDNLFNNLHYLSISDGIENLYYLDEENKLGEKVKVSKVAAKMIKLLNYLSEETYADTSSLLLMRNKAILNKTYVVSDFESKVKQVSYTRNFLKNQYFKSDRMLESLSCIHFTSPGIEQLIEDMKDLPLKELSNKEIHDISKKCSQTALAKVLLTLIDTYGFILPQLNKILKIEHYYENHFFLNRCYIEKNYIMETLKEFVPEKWYKKYKERKEIIRGIKNSDIKKTIKATQYSHERFNKKTFLLNCGLDPIEFNRQVQIIKKHSIDNKNKGKYNHRNRIY